MKVLDLQCPQGHCFEGWFGSQRDYDEQRARGLVACPVCHNSDIVKLLSAPRLNLGHGMAPERGQNPPTPSESATATLKHATAETPRSLATDPHTLPPMQADLLNLVRHIMANTEDVGPRFAQEARKIHYGECEERNIRGQATRQETEALLDEGIDVMPLPIAQALKGPLH
jgi:hypothetical protein